MVALQEQADVDNASFKFQPKSDAMDLCTSLASNMQIFPLQHAMSGPYVDCLVVVTEYEGGY